MHSFVDEGKGLFGPVKDDSDDFMEIEQTLRRDELRKRVKENFAEFAKDHPHCEISYKHEGLGPTLDLCVAVVSQCTAGAGFWSEKWWSSLTTKFRT